ncbi:TPA: hypothetical protein OW427_006334 [Pseudomonas aeruginosa]|jgi:hypothetical protein|uniref:hypothetical protein n=1 Tax=Pseudomonas TaxID=286 RepID=UPI00023200A7|nr:MULTISPECIES: hypothetical protein [Pseudomonas]EHF14433.1 hypothetical protein HMPREF1030_01722 [Pseudomonas aeruginosa]KAA5558629.1 hypothetical protein F3G51_28885 [Pseudomonas aeruginosa]KAA5559215.1 hypothetical protein F3G54_25750 [Pseudomonas aeruginosa]KAA5691652.1 hypothetical protein F3G93_15980 [Pseudomonas aeruginosa]KSC63145.1 hypothetical protein AO888_31275 [Pseudomonas aeruginosa]
MKKLIGVAALMAMAGCSSMSELRQEQPYRSFSSTKGVEQAAECVLFAWQNQSLAGVHYDVSLQPLPGGGRTVVSQGQTEFVDVVSTDRGSDISIYFQSGIMDWRKNSRIEAVKSCL